MREIKFRVWDDVAKSIKPVMSFWLNPDWTISHVVIPLNEDWSDCETLFNHFTSMQYTGFKDREGKEVFEGDILEDRDGSICFVVWEDGAFAVESPGSQAVDWEHGSFYSESKIVGNIHEHKHLIS